MAVSSIHEGLLELVRDRPAFAADLLTGVLDVRIPRFAEARIADSTLNQATPVENHADAAVLLVEGDPVLGVIVEAQLQEDARKHYTWPLYAIAARARHECPFIVLVVTLDTQVALWASRPIDLGDGMMFRPRVIGPDAIPKLVDADHGNAIRSLPSCRRSRMAGATSTRPFRSAASPTAPYRPCPMTTSGCYTRR